MIASKRYLRLGKIKLINYVNPRAIKVTLKCMKILMKSDLQKYRFMESLVVETWPDKQLFRQKKDESVVVIVGLHEGETAISYLERIPNCTLIGFEPNPDAFSIASLRLSKYGSRVRIFNKAIGATKGKCILNRYTDSGMNSILDSSDVEKVDSIEVEISTLDYELKHLKRVDVLQVDVQGSEIQVFSGAAKIFDEEKVDTIVTEALFKTLYEGQPSFFDIGSLLEKKFNFSGFVSLKFSRSEPFELMWVDAVFQRVNKNFEANVNVKGEY